MSGYDAWLEDWTTNAVRLDLIALQIRKKATADDGVSRSKFDQCAAGLGGKVRYLAVLCPSTSTVPVLCRWSGKVHAEGRGNGGKFRIGRRDPLLHVKSGEEESMRV